MLELGQITEKSPMQSVRGTTLSRMSYVVECLIKISHGRTDAFVWRFRLHVSLATEYFIRSMKYEDVNPILIIIIEPMHPVVS